ncbi:MAG: DUF885 domain-containing protein [Bacteroidia bacterium]|nr:DUF885 domain-containing protein [Bacteroidia bacterium]
MKFPFYLILFCLFGIHFAYSQSNERPLENILKSYAEEIEALDIAPLRIAYLDNLKGIKGFADLKQQKKVVSKYTELAKEIKPQIFEQEEKIQFDFLLYQLSLHRHRIKLEEQWNQLNLQEQELSETGLHSIPMGKEWYAYFLKRWIDLKAEPDSIFAFGLREIDRVKSNMEQLRQRSGLDSLKFAAHLANEKFYINSPEEVQAAFEIYRKYLNPLLKPIFPDIEQVPHLSISRGTDKRLARVPGFYRNQTFFYNIFDDPFVNRQIAWLYIHEGVPGHHYEISLRNLNQSSILQKNFYNPGYSEGWAAYVEDLGLEIEAYRTIYEEYGKWEWDIIRAVRVALDVAINYYGWSDKKALEFWQRHIRDQDEIGLREIARMKRWPAQVITYKYGSNKILQWKAQEEKMKNFELLSFHKKILSRGPLPYSILEDHIFVNKQN